MPHELAVSMHTPESRCHGHRGLDHLPDAGPRVDHRSAGANGTAGHPSAVPVVCWHHHRHGSLDHVPDAGPRADHRSAWPDGAERRPAGYVLPGIRSSPAITAVRGRRHDPVTWRRPRRGGSQPAEERRRSGRCRETGNLFASCPSWCMTAEPGRDQMDRLTASQLVPTESQMEPPRQLVLWRLLPRQVLSAKV